MVTVGGLTAEHLVDPLGLDVASAQTLDVAYGGSPLRPEDRCAWTVDLVTSVEAHGLRTGFLGTRHLLPALSAAGRTDLAYSLALAEDPPSWGHMVRSGATTVWERWDGWTAEAGFANPYMNSLCHVSLGSVAEWLHATVGGLVGAGRQAGVAAPMTKPVCDRPSLEDPMRTPTRSLIALALAGVVAAGGSAVAAPAKLGPNLVSNPGFEESQLEPAAATGQPLLPTDWTVEGASILFDHSQNVFKDGKRGAAISGALGGGRQLCDGSSGSFVCTPNPAAPATGALPLRPSWVTDAPIAVTAGKKYRFSTWIIMPSLNPDAGVAGEGAETRVRWLDAGGAVISTATGPVLVKTARRLIGWKNVAADLVAPKGAVGAQLLLGHTDYTTTSTQVAYDGVSFAQVK